MSKILPATVSDVLDAVVLRVLARIPARLGKRLMGLLHRNPRLGDRWGHSVREIHFYEPLPDFASINPDRIARRRESSAIQWKTLEQLKFWRDLSGYNREVEELAATGGFAFENESFCGLDAATYYSVVRQLKPANILEIGSGFSTQIAQLALAKNAGEGKSGSQRCVEPYPQPRLTDKRLPVELIQKQVQEVSLDDFRLLQAGDILFIDSTHTVKFDSDVCCEMLEILPALTSGVLIHIHDIFFPYDYPPDWIINRRTAWNEQYLVEAFLAYNSSFEIVLALHWLSTDHPNEAAQLWPEAAHGPQPSYRGSSLWLRKQ